MRMTPTVLLLRVFSLYEDDGIVGSGDAIMMMMTTTTTILSYHIKIKIIFSKTNAGYHINVFEVLLHLNTIIICTY